MTNYHNKPMQPQRRTAGTTKNRLTMIQTPTTNDEYAYDLLREAARMINARCPRCAKARLRRIARHDVDVYGADYDEALARRLTQLGDMLGLPF